MKRKIALIVLAVLISSFSVTAGYLTYRSLQNTDATTPTSLCNLHLPAHRCNQQTFLSTPI
jgi:hypothetical protein